MFKRLVVMEKPIPSTALLGELSAGNFRRLRRKHVRTTGNDNSFFSHDM
jgi:hypothetical protein